ncbi:MAG: glycosyltransferase [Candidatus Competibacteraceae bacterium]|nr:glycosyltransferase [Candidatus Competibacteraceae bacterium]
MPNCIEKVGPIKKINNEKLKSTIKAVTISRLHPQKNLLNCVEAIALLRERGCSISYHIYGKGELEEALAKKIHELNLSKQVILAGYTFNPAQALMDFDVYLSGSLYEGFPLSLLQAMRAGIPICSTNVGELVMNLSDKRDFFEIKGFSSEAIAAVIQMILRVLIYEYLFRI